MASFVDPSKLEAKNESESRQQPTPLRDFFWDSVVLYAAFGIIGLSAVNVVLQYTSSHRITSLPAILTRVKLQLRAHPSRTLTTIVTEICRTFSTSLFLMLCSGH